ncbi:class E sortase [Streptomyces ficellus]|uniref:Class E sortase n=1 Tax=Streptomyces ficellus TaxID=1977088 RepID=A0A6I6FFP0_9ACTN|nr:class E sortase [Streptomyces ficellus]QGV82064.1 class E sortase [Streptomyces ficellus]
MTRTRTASAALATSVVVAALVGCGAVNSGAAERPVAAVTGTASAASAASTAPAASPASAPAPGAPVAATPPVTPSPEPPPSETARTRTAVLAVPAIGVADLRVVPYEGTTDDWPGTRIQDRGVAASPYGPGGGVGPGEVGNYLVTAHRLSAGGPLRDLPDLKVGESVFVTSGGTVYEYRITETRQTSFRSERSLAEQRAAVPGEPGEKPTKAMITLSTCATPEDDAAGNFWRDAKGNPEHRIDKVGVLVSSRAA